MNNDTELQSHAASWHLPGLSRQPMRALDLHEQQALVFAADTDLDVRESLPALARFAGWRMETFVSAQDLFDRPRWPGPSCLVLDLDLPHIDGLALQQRIATERAEMPVIFIAGRADVRLAVQAMKAGALDFLMKPVRDETLRLAIEISLERSRSVLARAPQLHAIRERHATLTPRERQVMTLVVTGLLNKQVGSELGISEITVKAHRGRMMRKMKARSLPDLVNITRQLREAGVRNVDMLVADSALAAAA